METHFLFLIFGLWAWFHPFVILSSCIVSLPVIPVLPCSPCLALARPMLSLALLCAAGGCVLVAQCAVSCVGDSGMKISTSCVTPAQPWTMTHPADSICCWPTWSTKTRSSSNAHWPAWRMRIGQCPGKTKMSMGWVWSLVPFFVHLDGGVLTACLLSHNQSKPDWLNVLLHISRVHQLHHSCDPFVSIEIGPRKPFMVITFAYWI